MTLADDNAELFSALMPLVGTSAQLCNYDVGFFRALDSSLGEKSVQQSKKILKIISDLVYNITGEEHDIPDWGSLVKEWGSMVHCLDFLEDTISSALRRGESEDPASKSGFTGEKKPLAHVKELKKPQVSFKTPVTNIWGPFKPLLKSKPHGLSTFKQAMTVKTPDEEHKREWYDNPYKQEILAQEYPAMVTTKSEPVKPNDIDTEKVNYVDTIKKVSKMMRDLKKADIIAVDLEHHDLRTFDGLLCLMQISTRKNDYIVDTLALREDLGVLNEVFCNPKILKVFHGAKRDIMWLQRDLGLYVVSLFDTYYASQALGLPRHSLAYLLTEYAGFHSDKRYQLSDWRVRPLSPEMLLYATADTHFLIYIFEQVRNELLSQQNGKLEDVLQSSRRTAAQRYENLDYNGEPGWKKLLRQNVLGQEYAPKVKALYMWRDKLARELDESPRYIMTNQMLVDLVVLPPKDLPTLVQNLGMASHILKTNAREIYAIVKLEQKIQARSSKPLTANSEDLFSQDSLQSVANLRKPNSLLVKNTGTNGSQASKVDLTLYPDFVEQYDASQELAAPDAMLTEDLLRNEDVAEDGAEADASDDESSAQSGSKKRKLNIVTEAPKIGLSSRKPNKKGKNADAEVKAFDFDGEKQVLEEDKNLETGAPSWAKQQKFGSKLPKARKALQRATSKVFRK